MIKKETIRAYALENAIKHKGKSNQGSVLNSLFAEGLKKENIKETIPVIQEVIDEINSLSFEEQEAQYHLTKHQLKKREQREGLPELENAEHEKVVLRFAPFPSGPLHIGNTRQLILNDEYAKMYKGRLILVMDDTIGSEEKPIEKEAYKLIEEGVNWLDVNRDKKIIYKSDRIKDYYEYAEELIKKGYMYVCSCTKEEIRETRAEGVECPCRNLPESEHMKRWKEMFKAKEGEYVVRLKTSMQHPNPAFRDRVLFRISDREHPITKNKYRVWPLLEFSWAIDDHLLGVTHIIRGIDLIMETEVEKFIWNIFKWKNPTVLHTGHLAIQGIKISKSKGAKEVRAGQYIGWNDPRTWSLQSLRDRGIKPEAIREFIISMGMTKSNSTVAVDMLYAINRKFLEDCPRYFFVEDPIKIKISGAPAIDAELPLHPSKNLGKRIYETSQEFYIQRQDAELFQDKNYRLMHLLNFRSEQLLKTKPRTFSFISEDTDKNLDVKFIQWLPANDDNIVTKIRMDDGSMITGIGEPELANLKIGDQVQFERFGFVKLYKKNPGELEFWFTHR